MQAIEIPRQSRQSMRFDPLEIGYRELPRRDQGITRIETHSLERGRGERIEVLSGKSRHITLGMKIDWHESTPWFTTPAAIVAPRAWPRNWYTPRIRHRRRG
jgi:hypothetical protein